MRRTRRACLGALAALVGAGCLGDGRGGQGAGQTTTTATTTTDPTTTDPTTDPTTTTTPGTTTTTTQDGGDPTVEPASALQWTRSFDAAVALGPAVADGTVYVGTADGTLHALAPGGDERWRTAVGGAFFTGTGHDTSPVAADGTVYLTSGEQSGAHGTDYGVYALDAATGSLQWSSAADYPSFLSLLAVAHGRVYTATSDDVLGQRDETLAAHDAATGAVDWTAEIGDPEAVGTAGDAVAVADYPGLQVLDADGTVRWRTEELDAMAPRSPVFAGGHLLVATDRSANGLYALDPATGDRRWAHTDGFVNSLAVGERAYVGGETVAAYGFDGTEAWDAGVEAFVDRVHDDTLYCGVFAEAGGAVLALATADGRERWRYAVDAEVAEVDAFDDGIAAVSQQRVPVVDGLAPATGERQFRFRASDRRALSRPAVHDATVYVADGTTVYALA